MRNKQILLSGRAVVTNAANVPADRYTFLHLSDAEPNLGTANANGWVLVYDTETPGNRLWSKNLITAYDHANSAYQSQNTTGSYSNAAFLKANSAYESQNVTGTYANNAYTHANSAYESQNVTGTYANNAYTHANAANLQANSAYESQNVTGTYANNAYLHANSAYESQNTTGVYANAAFLKANSAYESQNTTGSYANSAFLKANSAYESQNVTGTYANNAYLHANSSYGSQNTTGSYANSAFLKANSAYESQNVTGVYTNTAFTYANSAGQYANSAFNYANSAYTHSNAAFVFANTRYSSNGGEISGDVVITGNLTIAGNVTTVSANTLSVKDNMIYLNDDSNTANPDLGFAGNYNDGLYAHAGLFRDATDGTWKFFYNYTPEPDASPYIDTNHASFRIANLTANVITDVIWLRGYDPLDASNAAYAHANAAYISQNTTGTYANASFIHANAANLQANSAYESQNVTGTYANNAYIHANSAYESQNTTGSYANASFLKANSAYESQNVTGTYANNAYLHANSAYDSQNVTGTYANNAYLHANSSYDSQNTTGNYANAAFLKANSAYDSQNTTGVYANAAFLKTNSAYQHANSSYDSQNVTGTYANSAYTNANAAFLKANSAYESQNVTGTYANNAYDQANSAALYANGSFAQANAAFLKANAAVFSITTNVNELYSNTSSGNIRLGLANVTTNIGIWGGNEAIPVINVDGHGRILSVSNTTISVPPGTYIFPNTGQITTNANFGNVLIGLANVNSNIGTFGSEFAVPTITTDGYGRITKISNTTISIPQGTYIVNSNLITSNSASGNVVLGLAPSGVNPGTYGGAGVTPVVTVDEYGRVTVAANVASAINALSTIVKSTYTATAAQTIFQTTSSFADGYVDVYINGIRLSPADYVADGSLGQITITGLSLLDGDVVDLQTATTYVVNANTVYSKVTYLANAGQTTFASSYVPGQINVYLNGLRLYSGVDFTALNGTTIQISSALEANDVVEIERLGSATIMLENAQLVTRNAQTVSANGISTFNVLGGYKVGFVDVYLNGIKLNIPGDVVANNGTSITFVSATPETGDLLEVNGIGPDYSIANAISIYGGTIYGDLTVTNTLNVGSLSISSLPNLNVSSNIIVGNISVNNTITGNTLYVKNANVTSNLNVTYNVTANAVNVATVYFNDGTMMSTAASGRGDGITWKIASANVTANVGEGLLVDTTSANVYVTLNASPYTGNTTRIVDMTGNFGINNCIVKGNGQKIMGLLDDLVISSNNAGIGLVYSNSTHGWRLIENP